MVRFNIIGTGFVDMAEGSGVSFTTENQQFRFCDISIGRSVSFSIPATDHNRLLLGFAENPAEKGEMLRKVHAAQCVYDGGLVNGTLSVTAYDGDTFKVVFRMGWSPALEAVQKKSIKECVTSYTNGVLWDGTYVTADNADPSQVAQVIYYDNGGVGGGSWGLVPSLCATTYIADILANLGLTFNTDLPDDFWLVSGSMNGSNEEATTFSSTGLASMAVSPSTNFDVVNIDVEWATANLFGGLVGGGSTATQGFQAKADVSVNFPTTMPNGVFLIKWKSKLKRCEALCGAYSDGRSPVDKMQGYTVDLKKGETVFFANIPLIYNVDHYGWQLSEISTNYSFTLQVVRTADISFGETWYLQFNQPDMTVFEFLKSLALATGRELLVEGDTISIVSGEYGKPNDFKPLTRVISVDSVTRVVDMWGGNTRKAVIGFDSEDYVTEPLTSTFEIDNEQFEETKEWKSKFSEGAVGTNGVLIKDVDGSASPPKFSAKKWTIARATAGSTYLQRVETPDPVGYDDIAENSTCVKVKVAAGEAEFFALTRSRVFVWRGIAYVWTNAQWSVDVLTLTLQKVSQPMLEVTPVLPNYLTLTAGTGGMTLRLDKKGTDTNLLNASLEYSTDDGVTWQVYVWTGDTGDSITLAEGEAVRWRGNNATFSRNTAYYQFLASGEFAASGDITTLIDANGGDVALPSYCFYYLFLNSAITQAPNLPSTTLGIGCYNGTFQGCVRLTGAAPSLPATTLANACYTFMFYNCTGITEAELPAEVLSENCYNNMLANCSSLAQVTLHATDISANYSLYRWLNGVAAVGVLRCDPSLTLPSGASGIPTGWTRENL